MKKIINYIDQLIRANTGVSMKSAFMFSILVIGILLLLSVATVVLVDVFRDGKVDTDLNGLSVFVGSISSLFVTAGLTKVLGEKYEQKDPPTNP